jgi:nuclear pore complex protein Nup93
MDALAEVHQKVKGSYVSDVNQQMASLEILKPNRMLIDRQTLANLRKKSRSLIIFAGILKYRMSPDVYSYLARLDVEIAL